MQKDILREDMEDIFSRRTDWLRLSGKTVLLTGAYGMLASYITYFIEYLNENNIDVKLIAVVRNSAKFFDKFKEMEKHSYIKVVESDLKREIIIDESVDYIIHAASFASPQYYAVCPVDVLEPNSIGNYYLLKLAAEKNVEGFLLFSTGDVYGAVEGVSNITETDYGVMDTLDIHNCYSESKRMAETMCKAFNVQYGVPTKIARIWHTYAPTMDIQNDPRVFSSFVKNIVNNEDIVMKSDGSGKRSFCYITDAIAGYFAILFDGKAGEAYNVCNSAQFLSIVELAEKLVNLYPQKKLKVIRKQRDVSEHYVENVHLIGKEAVPSNEKLVKLGWYAKYDISEGFKRVIEYNA